MTQRLADLAEQFCQYQLKQRGKAEGGVRTYRWMLDQFLRFVRAREGRLARADDLNTVMLQAWLDDMAASNLSINTLRCRQAAVSSFCNWLVKRNVLPGNPVAKMDRPPRQWTPARRAERIRNGCPHSGRERPGPTAGRGHFPVAAVHGDAARVGRDPPAWGTWMGNGGSGTCGSREERSGTFRRRRWSCAYLETYVREVSNACAGCAELGRSPVLVVVGQAADRPNPCPDDREEHLAFV